MKLIILDRDGVINYDSPEYIKTPEEWIPIPGSLNAISQLCHAGYRVVVATNQSGISRELFDIKELHRINSKMHRLVHEAGGLIDAIFFCSDKNEKNPDRKPNPGMLIDIARRLNLSIKNIPVVGDSLRDMRAAQAVDAKAMLVRTGHKKSFQWDSQIAKVMVFDDLADVARNLVTQLENINANDCASEEQKNK